MRWHSLSSLLRELEENCASDKIADGLRMNLISLDIKFGKQNDFKKSCFYSVWMLSYKHEQLKDNEEK